MPSQTIDEVIAELEGIIQQCIDTDNRAGYFAALYHRVTCRIKDGIANNEFEDGIRMERLDVLFANRYIDAWKQWCAGQQPTASWRIAFEAAQNKGIIMQHLLLGINAHINLDLGIATTETMYGYPITGIQKDFNTINAVLASLISVVEQEIFKLSPLMFLLDTVGKSFDEMLVEFSINTAREGAWQFAVELSGKTGAAYTTCISVRDAAIANLATNLAKPKGKFFAFIIKVIGWFEWKQPAKCIETLRYVAKKAAENIAPPATITKAVTS